MGSGHVDVHVFCSVSCSLTIPWVVAVFKTYYDTKSSNELGSVRYPSVVYTDDLLVPCFPNSRVSLLCV